MVSFDFSLISRINQGKKLQTEINDVSKDENVGAPLRKGELHASAMRDDGRIYKVRLGKMSITRRR